MSARPSRPRTRTATRRQSRVAAAVCPLIAGLLIAGCGGSHEPHVAALASAGHRSNSHSSTTSGLSFTDGIPDPDGRPRETLDDTEAQITMLDKPFEHCVDYQAGKSHAWYLRKAARCIRYIPLPPWQLDASNPQARAFVGRVVTCLQAENFHVEAEPLQAQPPFPSYWLIAYSGNPSLLFSGGPGETTHVKALSGCQQKAQR